MARALGILITLGVILLFLTDELVFDVQLLDALELKTYDMRLRALPRSAPGHVTIAVIDEKSLAKVGRWPWSRAVHAELVRKLDQLGARTIAFDIFFPERESAHADGQFAAAIGASGKVVLGTVLFLGPDDVRNISPKAIEGAWRAIEPQAISDVRVSGDPGAKFEMQAVYGAITNIRELQSAAAHTGHVNVLPDADGVVRRAPLVLRHEGRYYPAFDAQVARAYLGKDISLDLAEYGIAGLAFGGREVPLDEFGRLLVRYRGREGSFPRVSIADILDGKADASLLKDRVVLIGNTAQGIGDMRVTPYGPAFPGVEVRANVIESLLEGDVLRRPDWMRYVDVAGLLAIGILMVTMLGRLGVAWAGVFSIALLAGYEGLAVAAFRTEGWWLNMVYPALLVALLFTSATLVRYFFAHSEKRYLKVAFQHYVPPAVVDRLVSGADRLRLGGEKRELTVLFSDIRGFTSLSEAMDPEQLVSLLNEYFTAMTDKLFEHGGSLDKYIGDAIMAIFGAPVAAADHPARACRTALEMVSVLDALREKWRPLGLPALDIGVGVNTGPMIVGNMGSASRFNYTVVGDAVNLASRIESLNKTYGTSILVSEYTYAVVKDEFPRSREIDHVRVRGRTQPVALYELMSESRYPDLGWLDAYRAAYAEMRDGDRARAAELFAALHERSKDGASAYHAKACRYPARRQADA